MNTRPHKVVKIARLKWILVLPLIDNRSQTIKPGIESLPSFRSQLRFVMVGIDRRVQQRTLSWHQPSAPVPKVLPTCIRRSTVFGIS
jgi:hypothetical protein